VGRLFAFAADGDPEWESTGMAVANHGILDEDIAFIGKPFTPDSLARKAEEVLGQQITESR
jgi:hypothetical protein